MEEKEKRDKKKARPFGDPKSIPPSPENVTAYAESIRWPLDGDGFCDSYAQKGWLIGKFNEVKPAAAWYERVYRHEGTTAAHVYGGFQALLQELCAERSIDLTGIPVQTIKLTATNHFNANKDAVLRNARSKWPAQKILDHNQADALWILQVGLDVTAGRLVLPATTKATRKRAKKRQILLKII